MKLSKLNDEVVNALRTYKNSFVCSWVAVETRGGMDTTNELMRTYWQQFVKETQEHQFTSPCTSTIFVHRYVQHRDDLTQDEVNYGMAEQAVKELRTNWVAWLLKNYS